MAQWLRALAILPEQPELIPSTYMAAENCNSSSRGPDTLLAFMDMRYTGTHAGKTLLQIRKQNGNPSTLKGGRGVDA